MFKLPLKFSIVFIFVIGFSLLLTQTNCLSADLTFDLVHGLNGISLPFENAGINNAEQLCQSVPYCESVSYWNAPTQKFITHKKGAAENNFSLTAGYPYFVSLSQDGSWMVSGTIPQSITFNLITTDGTDINVIALPINMSNITTAEELVKIIPNADIIWYWDALGQGYVGHPKGTEINDFNVFVGYPYFINVTADGTWTIRVALKVKINANPKTGHVPLEVQFSASVEGGTPPYTYSWDVDGNGTPDDTRESFTHIYQQAGIFTVNLSVTDAAGRSTSDNVIINVTNSNPISIPGGPYKGQVGQLIQFDGSGSSDPDGDSITFSWNFGDGSTGTGMKPSHTYSTPGNYTVTLTVSDGWGSDTKQTTAEITAPVPAPAITGYNPSEGPVGTVVTIEGTNFDAGGLRINFNGTSAIVSNFTNSSITTTVPLGATTGPITVTTNGGTATSASNFVVTLLYDFNLTVTPQQAEAARGGQVTYTVSVTGTNGFSNLVALSVQGLPSGFSGFFSPKTITSGQTSTLYITACDNCSAENPITLTFTGSTDISGVLVARSVTTNLVVLTPGITTLVGRVLDTDGLPIKNVAIRVEDSSATTDESGNFLFENPPTGDHVVLIDGSTASTDAAHYPTIPITMNIIAGQTNVLPYVPHLHAQKNYNFTTINPTKETVAEDPGLPGLQLRIPPGVDIIGWDGEANAKVSMRQVPLDALPVPPPPPDVQGNSVYMFYFGKVGGGVPTTPIPVTVPNDLGLNPGEKAELWYFNESPNIDEAPNEWSVAGTGTVSADGKTITTDPGVGIPRFCCGAITVTPTNPTGPNIPPGDDPDGKQCKLGKYSVEPSTGVFVHSETDLSIPGKIPIEITRTYRSMDTFRGPYGVGTYFGYDWYMIPYGNMATLVKPPGTRISFSRQPDGGYINTNEPAYRGARLTFNPDGTRTLRMKDGTTYTFEATAGLLVGIEDRNRNRLTFERAVEYNVNKIIGTDGRTMVTFNINILGRDVIAEMTDIFGRKTTYTYDYSADPGTGRLMSVTNPEGGITHYGYDSQGRMTSIIDPRGNTVLNVSYDVNGLVCKEQYADGGAQTYYYITADQASTYAALNLLQEAAAGGPISTPPCSASASSSNIVYTIAVDPNGNPTAYRFNSAQKIISITNAGGQSSTSNRELTTNLVMSRTDSLGRTTSYTYDNNGNMTSKTDADGKRTYYEYESAHNLLTKVTDCMGNVTRYEYDSRGNRVKNIDPLGHETAMIYDNDGRLISITNQSGNTTQFEYDENGNLSATIDPLGNKNARKYDEASRLISETNPVGRTTLYTYNNLDKVTNITDAVGNSTKYEYDMNGNLLKVIDPNGNSINYAYDERNRLKTMTDQLGNSESYVYDSDDNLIIFTDRNGNTTAFAYDAFNRKSRIDYADGSSITYTYDALSRLIRIYDSVSGSIEDEYDNSAGCTNCGGGSSQNKIKREITPLGTIEYEYDALGRRTSMNVNGQTLIEYKYNDNSLLTDIIHPTLGTVNISYDDDNRRKSLTLPNGIVASYSYDDASRLLDINYMKETAVIKNIAYTNDDRGNRTSFDRGDQQVPLPETANATFNKANQMLISNNKNIAYDKNGNMVSVTDTCGTTNYTWDLRNRLVGISGFDADCKPLTASFKYDGLNRRIEKNINDKRIGYVYDGNDIIAEIESGVLKAGYLRGLSIDEAFASEGSEGKRYYLVDGLGSTIALTDSNGQVRTQYSYDPHGVTTMSGEQHDNSFQYTGRENDGTGLYYYRARYYSPSMHRFTAPDPIGLDAGINFYAYTLNNPINLSDPFGEQSLENCWADSQKCQQQARVRFTKCCGIPFSDWAICFTLCGTACAAVCVSPAAAACPYCIGSCLAICPTILGLHAADKCLGSCQANYRRDVETCDKKYDCSKCSY